MSGGAGTLDNEFVSPMTVGQIGRSFDLEYNYDLHLGYRYRLRQNDWLFWDLDALFGIKSFRKGILTITWLSLLRRMRFFIRDFMRVSV